MRIDTVTREDVPIVFTSEPGTPEAIGEAAGRAFQRLEAAIPPRGRRIYGFWDPGGLSYHACYAHVEGDRPDELGLAYAVLPGGLYRRGRLRGDDVFARIGPAFEELASGAAVDTERPWLEFYRRHDEVDVLVPVRSS